MSNTDWLSSSEAHKISQAEAMSPGFRRMVRTLREAGDSGASSGNSELFPCPFCGEQPEMETDGTWVEINCCASMTCQKSDYLTWDERQTWETIDCKFSPKVEAKVRRLMIAEWNTRAR